MDQRQIEELTDEALAALEGGDYVRAVAISDQLTAVVPEDPAVRAIRAEALLKNEAGDEALAEARRAVELDARNHHLHTLVGLAAWRADKLTLAQESLERAVELSGEEPQVVADLAFFMAAARGPRLAEAAANEAICGDHKCAAAWAALGLAQFRLRRRLAAEASLKRALELDPNHPYAQAVMLAVLCDRRDNARAVGLARLLDDSRRTEQFIATRLFFRSCGFPDAAGTDEIVEAIQHEAKKRQVQRALIERRAVREPTYYAASPRKLWLSLIIAAVMTAGLLVLALAQPDRNPLLIALAFTPLVLFWVFRGVFD